MSDCLQFSYSSGHCGVSSSVKLGHSSDSQCLEYGADMGKCVRHGNENQGVGSGWMMDRVWKYAQELDNSCNQRDADAWVVEEENS